MSTRKVLTIFGIITLCVSVPFGIIHLIAAPDDAAITPLQHLVAALANYFGPWGVAVVRLVDFPNAGLRSFSWALAAGLTLTAAVLLMLAAKVHNRRSQILLSVVWVFFTLIWFGVGLRQIADGLL